MQTKFTNRTLNATFNVVAVLAVLIVGGFYFLVEAGHISHKLFNASIFFTLAAVFLINAIVGIVFEEIAIKFAIIRKEQNPIMFLLTLTFFLVATVLFSLMAVDFLLA